MASISPDPASQKLLDLCLTGQSWSEELLDASLAERDGRAFLRIVVEYLADSFEPRHCDTYARLFSQAIERLSRKCTAHALIGRYARIRQPRKCTVNPATIYVLSRVTLGADVAVTSVVLDGLKRRFPSAEIHFVGSRKNFELFESDPRIRHLDFQYPRSGDIRDRLLRTPDLTAPNSIVVDPDSRLTQLGLLPVCADLDYYLFESRAYGGDSHDSLVSLTSRWVEETFDIPRARPYIAPQRHESRAQIAVSLGVGENPEKRINDAFEEQLIRLLAGTGCEIVLDEGPGGEEAERARRIAHVVPRVTTWRGAYAPFASRIAQAKLYVGYDSAGQHVAAACGIPLLCIFAGHVSDRMFARWRPAGPDPSRVIKVTNKDAADLLTQVGDALQNFTL